ncbi:MAG: TMEM175 family protein [Coriobacteriia bacterium]|nr:TMEM175 family protein [Coriobacteriia bacterium]
MIKKSRVEAFSDGVLAIVATIMVLELVLPGGVAWGDFAAQWPVLLAFVISFFQIYINLYNHNKLFGKIECVGRHVYLLNGLWLLFACFVPFTVHYLGHNPDATLPMLIYLVNLLLWAISFQILDITILHENPKASKDESTTTITRVIYYVGLFIAGITAIFIPRISLFIILIVVAGEIITTFFKATKTSDKSCK